MWAGAPDGYGTRELAVRTYMKSNGYGGSFILTVDGEGAWLIRKDGTAEAQVRLVEEKTGFRVQGHLACA